MDLFFSVVISGMAVGYITELAVKLFDSLIPKWITRMIATVPTSILMHYLLGSVGWQLIPLGLASGFFALVMMSVVNRVSLTKR